MALSEDLLNFDLIETHKENIQSLPGGRSVKQLASILSPLPSTKTGSDPTFNETKTLNDAIRQEYETELLSIADSDDPLDIYDRFVKWTLNAYPSAQATPQSQLLPLLERATKSFLTSSHYKNDPRYLKLWLHYIRFFSDTPRETFAFLARHHIGETLGLFYEEFAAWLEGAGRWSQADEVYRMGIEREARPAERLMRKYNQFQQRYEARPQDNEDPSSPALPTVRHALATKIDPFAAAPRSEESQRGSASTTAPKSKSGKAKMAIFSDSTNEVPAPVSTATRGWDSIGSMKERKKENTIEAKPWVGEVLKAGKRVGTVPKMEIFKDPNSPAIESKTILTNPADAVNSRTGRLERVFVNLNAIYPNQAEEYSFEELRAIRRGWLDRDWKAERIRVLQETKSNVEPTLQSHRSVEPIDVENLSHSFQEKFDIHESSTQPIAALPDSRHMKQKKLKHREVKQETQTVKTRLDSPTGRKVKRKASAPEPTMTFHSKAAMNDIYNLFNHSKKEEKDDLRIGDESDQGDDTYSTAGESVGTGRISGNNSEFGDDTTRSFGFEHISSQPDGESSWSDFSVNEPNQKSRSNNKSKHRSQLSDELTGQFGSSQDQTMGGFDTQAIAALADQDFGDLDTKMIAKLAGDADENEEEEEGEDAFEIVDKPENIEEVDHTRQAELSDLKTPVEEAFSQADQFEVKEKPRYVPIPPEDYEPTPLRPYRDPAAAAHNKLPFMTPIVEQTESSMAPSTIFQNSDYFTSKTPSKPDTRADTYGSPSRLHVDNLLLSSPAQESPISVKRSRSTDIEDENARESRSLPKKNAVPSLTSDDSVTRLSIFKEEPVLIVTDPVPTDSHDILAYATDVKKTAVSNSKPVHKGPIILDLQCNPFDESIRQQILNTVHPSITSYAGFDMNLEEQFNHHNVLKAFAAKQKKEGMKSSPKKSQNEKTLTRAVPPLLKFNKTDRVYAVKRELGKGAYAPVYLVDSYNTAELQHSPQRLDHDEDDNPLSLCGRRQLEAIKSESPPLTLTWEFHILHLIRSRLGDSARAMSSIVKAQECHLYRDECYLVLDYHSQGTLLDLTNLVRLENGRAGKTVEGVDETVAMFLSAELLRTMDDIWRINLLHGDLKIDNCLVRFNNMDVSAPYARDGSSGWASKGLTLIDFGRGVDLKAFKPEAKFVADWKAEETDCAEIREARPWKYEIDLFGAAGVIHSLLFGKYIDTVATGGGGLGQRKECKLRENLKRYWEREIWSEVFDVLMNGGKLNGLIEVRTAVTRVRTLMEDWLEAEGERGGRDLRSSLRRYERLLKSR